MCDDKTLYQLTIDAEEKVSTYKNPDIRDWISAIDPVLEAAGVGMIGNDYVEDIIISDVTVLIKTTFIIRGCENTNTICIPVAIIKDENPVLVATRYRLNNELTTTKRQVADAQLTLTRTTARVAELERKLAELNQG